MAGIRVSKFRFKTFLKLFFYFWIHNLIEKPKSFRMESVDNKDEMRNSDSKFNQEIHSKVVRAGKRTYFFDVKSTRNEEFYLTITESKKKFEDNGNFHYEKHKIFLYKEDFQKFTECLQEIIDFINENKLEEFDGEQQTITVVQSEPVTDYSNVDFEDI
jgi:hypothetical protein